MLNMTEIADRYVAVWNENDPEVRRSRIRALWRADGTTCYRLLDARGHEAIEGRVVGAWNQWRREGKFVFRPQQVAALQDALQILWEMVTMEDGRREASGLSYLLVDRDGRLRHDYQFNPSASDGEALAARCIALANEADGVRRAALVGELWAPQGELITAEHVATGHDAIAEAVAKDQAELAAGGLVAVSAERSQTHHHLARFAWQLKGADGTVAATGADMLILDEGGRIVADYRFVDAA